MERERGKGGLCLLAEALTKTLQVKKMLGRDGVCVSFIRAPEVPSPKPVL